MRRKNTFDCQYPRINQAVTERSLAVTLLGKDTKYLTDAKSCLLFALQPGLSAYVVSVLRMSEAFLVSKRPEVFSFLRFSENDQ